MRKILVGNLALILFFLIFSLSNLNPSLLFVSLIVGAFAGLIYLAFQNSKSKKSIMAYIGSFLFLFFLLIFNLIFIRFVLYDYFRIVSSSMEPTIGKGDLIFINRLDRKVKRGDIIGFKVPRNGNDYIFIKRVVGLSGDTIKYNDIDIYINGKKTLSVEKCKMNNMRYHDRAEKINGHTFCSREDKSKEINRKTFTQITIMRNQYFIIGDNRTNSFDSRHKDWKIKLTDKIVLGKVHIFGIKF